MTNEHTPGPWTFIELGSAPTPGFVYGIGHDPFGPSDIPWPIALAVTDADARLIASAPEMLTTLHRAELTLHEMSESEAIHSVHRNILQDVAKGLRNAIEAAMGGGMTPDQVARLADNCPTCGHSRLMHHSHNRADLMATHCSTGGFAPYRHKPLADEYIGLHDDCCGCTWGYIYTSKARKA